MCRDSHPPPTPAAGHALTLTDPPLITLVGLFYLSAPSGLSSHSVACSFGGSNLQFLLPWKRREVG